MKRIACLLATLLLCTSCTALPAEERAFAVVLMVEKGEESIRVHGRIPTYQAGGGYITVTGEGQKLSAALADIEAKAPMEIHLSQLRLLVLDASLGREASAVLLALSDRPDMRQGCAVAVTEAEADALMEAFKPETGTRLSKSIDVLLDARIRQGAILPCSLTDVIRMGERQTPVLAALTLADGKPALGGGWPMTHNKTFAGMLTPEECALLALLRGDARELQLTLPEGSAKVRDASIRQTLAEDRKSAEVTLTLRMTASGLTPEGLEQNLAEELLTLLSRLSAQGCDVLGLGRKAILRAPDWSAWRAMDWPTACRQLRWKVFVGVQGPA